MGLNIYVRKKNIYYSDNYKCHGNSVDGVYAFS